MDSYVTRYSVPVSAEHLDAVGYKSALAEAQQALGADPLAPLDAVIHGVGVRLYTNSVHWRDFWSANWFAPSQWAALTGAAQPDEPKIHVYASTEAEAETPWAGYSLAHTTAFLAGDTSYGSLRALALGSVAYSLADEEAVHFVPGLCAVQDGEPKLMLDAPGMDRPSAVAQLMANTEVQMVALDGVFVRYGLVRMVDGVTLLPTQVIDEQGFTTHGYRLFPWLDDYGFDEPRADTRCLTLQGEQEYCFARDLDLGRAPDAMAFPLEQAWYVPTQIVATDPGLVGALWPDTESKNRGLLENVPALTPDLPDRFGQWASEAVSALGDAVNPSTRSLVERIGDDQVVEALCRLRAASEGRVLVSPEQIWPGRAGGNPWRSVRIGDITMLGSVRPASIDVQTLSEYLASAGAYPSGLYEEEANRVLTKMLGRAITRAK
jgi:hypothetical protein